MDSLYTFLDNKYTSIYNKLIERARFRKLDGYVEKHHVIPRSLVKTNDVVKLTAREHILCHLLLTKMTDKNVSYKMLWALHRMMSGSKKFHPGRNKPMSRAYEYARLKFIQLLKQPKSKEHKNKIAQSLRGHKVSKETLTKIRLTKDSRQYVVSNETKLKMSNSAKGKPKSEETRQRMSKPKSEEHKRKLSEVLKGRPSSLKGKPKSEETKKRMSEADRNYMKGDNWKESHALAMKKRIGKIFINDGSKNKIISPGDLIPSGWKIGLIRGNRKIPC